MSLHAYLVLILLFCSICLSYGSNTCTMFQMKTENLNKHLNGHNFSEIEASSQPECAKMCMSHAICKSTDYHRPTKTCKLNDVDSTSVQAEEFVYMKGAIFSDISEWPSEMIGSCGTRPCAYTQRCVPNYSSYDCIDTVNRDCKDVLLNDSAAKSGLYKIVLWKYGKEITVYCDMETDGGGWTLIQRRFNGLTDFYRNYAEYENGFGDVWSEFWLGLKNIKELADSCSTEIRLDVALADGTQGYEQYENFRLEHPEYTLKLGNRTGHSNIEVNKGSMFNNNGLGFSAFDHDVDQLSDVNCAVQYHGAWWYRVCAVTNLNGRYPIEGSDCTLQHIHFAGNECLSSASIMIRRIT